MTSGLSNYSLMTCTFNNNAMTCGMLLSFKTFIKANIPLFIIDNGTTELASPFMKKTFHVFDNSNYKFTKNYPCRSRTHAEAIEYALKHVINTKYVLLCDNDIIFKPKIQLLLNAPFEPFDAIGEIGYDLVPPNRLFPYFCIINVEKLKTENISYNRFIGHGTHDTGCSFLEDIQAANWKIKPIKLDDYIYHLKGGTLHGKNYIQWLKTLYK